MLLVLCRDRATAEWAAGPFRVGHPSGPNLHITPFVLGPDNVPVLGDAGQAAADIPLAVLSALTHSDDPGIGAILETLAAALTKTPNDDLVTVCCDLTASVLADSPAAEIWRQLMSAGIFGLRGFVAEGLRDEGRVEGRAETQAASLVKVVQARGIVLPETAQARIAACRDIDTLDRWFDRALTATTLDDVFRDDSPAAGA